MPNSIERNQDRTPSERIVSEEKSLAALYDKYYHQIRRYIASRTNSSADADDLAQDVFLEFCKSNRYQNAEAYLFGIARKTVLADHRKRKTSPKIVPVGSIEAFGEGKGTARNQEGTKQISENDLKTLFDNVMKRLPPKALEAVKLRLLEGLDPEAAAKKAGCPVDIFYRRLYEGLKALRSTDLQGKS